MQKIKVVLFLLFFGLFFQSFGQKDFYYRVRADFSVKEKSSEGRNSLTMGKVYYDKARKRIVYNVLFPEKEMWLFTDSVMYVVKGNNREKKPIVAGNIDFSVFNLSLNNKLKDYGLKNSIYSLKEVTRDEDLVISLWEPKKEYAKLVGNIRVAVKDNRLYGVLVYDASNKLIGRQVFSEYSKIGSFEFPTEIINITYLENGVEVTQITTYSNIKVNNWDEDYFYNYNVTEPY